jgi:UDP-N-acetylglucosamine acyltransferase
MDQHPTAIISPKAEIGINVKVGPFSIIEDDVIIGDNSVIDSHVSVKSGVRLGKNVKISYAAALGGPPQDLKYAGQKTELHVGDNTIIREFVTLNRGTAAHGKTEIGKDCLFMAYCHAAHDCMIGDGVVIANSLQMGGHVTIGNFATLGGGSVIHQFCHVGEYSMIGGGFRVTQDVLPYTLVAGFPSRCMGLNTIGLKRRGFSPETIMTLKKFMHILLSRKLTTSKALKRIDQEIEKIPEVLNLLDFINKSDRGILK